MSRRTAAARALACACAIAGTVLALSGARAAGETDRTVAADGGVAASVPLVVASLSTPSAEPNNETAVQADRATAASGAHLPRVRVTITGDASFYEEKGKTSSGERYDPQAFTAAAQILLRDQFGGIRFGRNYQPAYGVAEWGGKKAIVKFNDVGPLAPGRAFDFSRAAMEYFDGIDLGVLPHVTVMLLPFGRDYAQGPVTDAQLAAIEAEIDATASAPQQALFVTASSKGAGCGSISASLQPISLGAIQAKLVRTASLDLVAPPDGEGNGQFADADLANDLGATAQPDDLP